MKKNPQQIKVKSKRAVPKKKDRSTLFIAIAIIITFFTFSKTFQNGFVNFDDERYVLNNPYIENFSFDNIKFWFSDYYDGHYHPLTMFSLTIDNVLGNKNPKVFHFFSLLFHLINVFLLFKIAKKLFRSEIPAFFLALLFGIHPLQVESVAWISERKNLLFTLFYFLSIIEYIGFLKTESKNRLIMAIVFFVLSCFSKVTAIALFPTLFIIEYLFQKKLFSKQLILSKTPFLIVSLVFVYIASNAQSSTWNTMELPYTFMDRVFLAGTGFAKYIFNILLPLNLSAYYPYPVSIGKEIGLFNYVSPLVGVAFVIAIVVFIKKGNRMVVFGLSFFILNIAMLLKLFDIPHGNYLLADRYAYVPMIGLCFILVYIVFEVVKKQKRNSAIWALSIYTSILVILSFGRVGIWNNSVALWDDVIKKYPDYSYAYNMRGMGKIEQKNIQGALLDFQKVTELKPDQLSAYMNIAEIHIKTGNAEKAIENYSKAINLSDTISNAWLYRGVAKFQLNDLKGALSDLSKAIELNNKLELAYMNRGLVYNAQKNHTGAISDMNKLIEINPQIERAYYIRGLNYFEIDSIDLGCKDMQQAYEMGIQVAREEMNKYCNKK
jgi:Tfp pilus assembly protein PilF